MAWVLLLVLLAWSWVGGVAFRAGYLRRAGWNLYFNSCQVRFLRNAPVAMIPAACFFTSMLGVVLFGSTRESADVPVIAEVSLVLLVASGFWFGVVVLATGFSQATLAAGGGTAWQRYRVARSLAVRRAASSCSRRQAQDEAIPDRAAAPSPVQVSLGGLMPVFAWVGLIVATACSWTYGFLFRAGYLRRTARNLLCAPYRGRLVRHAPFTLLPNACVLTTVLGVALVMRATAGTDEGGRTVLFLLLLAAALMAWALTVVARPPEYLKPRWLREEERHERAA